MKIKPDGDPIAGKVFGIDVMHDEPIQIRAFVGSDRVWEHDCPDPPCHEQFLIAREYAGQTLKIASRSVLSKESTSIELDILADRSVL